MQPLRTSVIAVLLLAVLLFLWSHRGTIRGATGSARASSGPPRGDGSAVAAIDHHSYSVRYSVRFRSTIRT